MPVNPLPGEILRRQQHYRFIEPKMNQLWQIYDNGATYWVVASDYKRAIELVKLQDGRDDYDDDPHLDYPMNARNARGLRFRFADGESCTLWNAFELCRESEQILSCSEWP